ncbi:hypothetical protein HDE_03665 [Halotydeus destructor]|nr:hypothetical protein HDE_03665 [Halotydeus destructor]
MLFSDSALTQDTGTVFMEEYHDLVNKRGRIDMSVQDTENIALYDDATLQYVVYQTSGNNSLCHVTNFDANFQQVLPWGDYDVDKKNNIPLIVGPSAIWRNTARTSEVNTKQYYKGTETIRGITCDKWEVPLKSDNHEVVVKLYFISENWKKFEKVSTPVPVRFLVDGTVGKFEFSYEVDYFLFEAYPETWRQFESIIGIGCEGRKSPEDKPFPAQDKTDGLLKQFAATIETKESSDLASQRYDWYVDYVNMVFRSDAFDEDDGLTKRIQDMRTGVSYTFTPGSSCKIGHVSDDFTLNGANGGQRVETLQEILSMNGNFYYVGTSLARGIVCDVWERVITDVAEMEIFGVSAHDTAGISKIVVSHFFTTARIDVADNPNPKIVQTLINVYKHIASALGSQYSVYNKISQQEVNFFNFRPLFYDRTYDNIFNVRQCFFDSADRLFLDMEVTGKSKLSISLAKHVDHLKQAIVATLASTLGISPLRVGQVGIQLSETSFMVNALLLGKPPVIAAFADMTETGSSSPTDLDKGPFHIVDENDCAVLAAKEKDNTGFLVCSDTCYTMTRALSVRAKPITGGDKMSCKLFYRDLDNAARQRAWKEPELKDIELTLKELVKSKKLAFTLSQERLGDEVTDTTYIVDTVQVASNTQRRLETRRFVQTISGSKINSTGETVLEKPEADTLGACYGNCADDVSIDCQSFSFCRTNSKVHCVISSVRLTSESTKDSNQSYVEPDTQCSVYTVAYLNRFTKLDAKTARTPGGTMVDTELVNSVNDCAQQCTKSTSLNCQSFQFCTSGHCFLHKEHYYDMTETENHLDLSDVCDFYSQNYLFDFTMTGSDLVTDDKPIAQLADIAVDSCAQRCAKRDDCASINYCPENSDGVSTCVLNTKSLAVEPGTKTEYRALCRNYDKKFDRSFKTKRSQTTETVEETSGYSGGTFFVLVLVMFFVGVGLGIGSYVGTSHYKTRRAGWEGSWLTTSIRFKRQQDDS